MSKNFKESMQIFIQANILYSVDKKLLDIDVDKIQIDIKEIKDFIYSIEISVEGEEKPIIKDELPMDVLDYKDKLRAMVGVTMVTLTELAKKYKKKPVLTVIEGGKA